MLKRILFALALPALGTGCIVEHRRPPRVVQPHYVAQCPAGYRYDGSNCHRVRSQAAVRIGVHD